PKSFAWIKSGQSRHGQRNLPSIGCGIRSLPLETRAQLFALIFRCAFVRSLKLRGTGNTGLATMGSGAPEMRCTAFLRATPSLGGVAAASWARLGSVSFPLSPQARTIKLKAL